MPALSAPEWVAAEPENRDQAVSNRQILFPASATPSIGAARSPMRAAKKIFGAPLTALCRMFRSGNRSRSRPVSCSKTPVRGAEQEPGRRPRRKEDSMFPASELPMTDDDPVSFHGPPDWLVSGLRSALREAVQDGLGLRSLIERADEPPRPWSAVRRSRSGRRPAPVRVRRAPLRGVV
jgi:hypothetical protein